MTLEQDELIKEQIIREIVERDIKKMFQEKDNPYLEKEQALTNNYLLPAKP